MKLWIRSQDKKELKQTKSLWISTETIHNHNNFNMYEEAKVYHTIVADGEQFAKYETKDRALQVLDEIQNALVGKVMVEVKQSKSKKEDELPTQTTNIKPLNQNCVVYELPRE